MSDNPVWKVDFTHLLLGVVTLLTLFVGLGSWFYAFDASIMGALVWMLGVPILTPAVAVLILLAIVIRMVAIRGVDRSLVIPLVVWAVSTWPVVWLFGIAPIAWPISIEDVDVRVDAQLPLRGDVVVGWGGDSISQNYHAFTPAQRWAYDLMYEPYNVGYAEGQPSSRLEDYGCFGKRVLSPIEGEVVFVRNGYEDQVPGKLPENPGYVMGNSVAIRWAKNTDAVVFMAHFMKGSVMVQEGQMVKAGQPIGRCGNSGNTSEPHVHIHAEFTPDITNPDLFGQVGIGVPLYFDLEDGLRMPVGGDDPEIVRAKQQEPVVLTPTIPWTIRYTDGSNNQMTFAHANADEEASFVYSPITPMQSSSGVYSGGDPAEGTLTPEQAKQLWEWVNRLAADTDAHLEHQRPKGSGVFAVEAGASSRRFVMGFGERLQGFDEFVRGVRE